ncbi:MAG: immunoglobulin domain-containing protein [Verrucomicrobia bacterium]|nr:immunoglobulin domain-containing protein [Verrucomicrobiota bacterium]
MHPCALVTRPIRLILKGIRLRGVSPALGIALLLTPLALVSPTTRAAQSGTTHTFSYPGFISMPDFPSGPASPYPAAIQVSGLTAAVHKVTVTLRQVTHPYADELDVLLVGPQGQAVVLMSDGGDPETGLSDVTLTFDGDSTNTLPFTTAISSGTYLPSNYGGVEDNFFTAPGSPPWSSSLAVFQDTNPNGPWSLYVVDDAAEDGGTIYGGWQLTLETVQPLHDLGLAHTDHPDPVAAGGMLTYTIDVTNHGPAAASGVVVTSALPAGATFLSATASYGTWSQESATVVWTLGGLDVHGAGTATIQVTPLASGNLSATAGIAASGVDPSPADNAAMVTTLVLTAPEIFSQPEDVMVVAGGSASFRVTAAGDALSYQWYFNGAAIAGANAPICTISGAEASHEGGYTVAVTNAVGAVTSTVATLTLAIPPAITASPASRTNFAGTTATFAVDAAGTGPLTFQWRFQDTRDIPGATAPVLTLTNVQPADAGSYCAVVTNAVGAVTSAPATLTVWTADFGDAPAPYPTTLAEQGAHHLLLDGLHLGMSVDAEPDGAPSAMADGDDTSAAPDEDGVRFSQGWPRGQSAVMEVLASAPGVLNAWADFNGNGSWADPGDQILTNVDLAAGTNLLGVAVPAGALPGPCLTRFRFGSGRDPGFTGMALDGEVEDHVAAIGSPVDLAVSAAAQPDPVAVGSLWTLTLIATNGGPMEAADATVVHRLPAGLSFVSASASQGSCSHAAGVLQCDLGALAPNTAATVQVAATAAQAGFWTNSLEAHSGGLELAPSDNAAEVTVRVMQPPAITAPPLSQTVTRGEPVQLVVEAVGDDLRIQWFRNGVALPGATGAVLAFASVQLADAGNYTVRITNEVGAVLSDPAALTVLGAPRILAPPLCKTAFLGSNHTFTVTAEGEPPPAFQWLKDGVPVEGATGPALALVNLQPSDAGNYQVVLTNTLGSVTSIVARLAVLTPDDPAYPEPVGGWAYSYAGDALHTNGATALDGTWTHDNSSDAWALDGRGAGVGLPGGLSTTQGVLTLEDAVSSLTADNRRFHFMHNLDQDAQVAAPDSILNDGITLSFRARLTPAAPTDPLTELAGAPNGAVNSGNGHGMIGIRQSAAPGMMLSFSLNQAVEDTSPTATYSFGQAGLHMNNLFGETPNAFVDPGEFGDVNLLPLDPGVFHHFWITITNNGADPGTHRVAVYRDGSYTPAVFNVTAGNAVDTVTSGAPVTNYLALSVANLADQVGAFDLDFVAYRAGVLEPGQFDIPVAILRQPASQAVAAGASALFTVDVTGTPPVAYQWRRDGIPIPGATLPHYATPPVTPADDGAVFSVVVSNFCGAVTSAPATLELLLPPQIVAHPQSQDATNGEPARLTVLAGGEGTLVYQWYFNDTVIPEATADTLLFDPVQPDDGGPYYVVVANDAGSVTSAVAVLTVRLLDFGDAPAPYPTLRTDNGARHLLVDGVFLGAGADADADGQPDGDAMGDDIHGDDEDGVVFVTGWTVGQPAQLNVTASVAGFLDAWCDSDGNGTWADPGERLLASQPLAPGANALTVAVPLEATVARGFVRFRFSTAGGLSPVGIAADGEVEDYAVPLTLVGDVGVSMTVTPDPVAVGGPLTFEVTVGNTGPSPAGDVVLSGALPGNAVLVEAAPGQGSCAQIGDTVRCDLGTIASGGAVIVHLVVSPTAEGTVTQTASATTGIVDVNPLNNSATATATAQLAPAIVTAPLPQTALAGDPVTFTVVASGASLSYQWRRDGVEIPDQTNATLAIAHAQLADAGYYSVRVSNPVGAVESTPVLLTVQAAPVIVRPPETQRAYAGGQVTFTVQASGTEPLSYQWFFNGTHPLPSATGPTLVLAPVDTNHTGLYRVRVTNSVGAATSPDAALTVLEADFGDAPPPYPTLLVDNGPRHVLVPGVRLGTASDDEPDGQPEAEARGDDLAGLNDEDGVTLNGPWYWGQWVTVQVMASTHGVLDAWVDFDGNGSWAEPGDRVATQHALAAGPNAVAFVVPVAAVDGRTFARFRFTTAGGLASAGGEAPDGEVEDYTVTLRPAMDVAVTLLAAPSPVAVGSVLTYTHTVSNLGSIPATDVWLTNWLPSGITLNAVASSQGECTVEDGRVMCALGTLEPAGAATLTLSVTPTTAVWLTNGVRVAGLPDDANPGNNAVTNVVHAQIPPKITTPPLSQSVSEGATVTLTVAATGTALNYQWRFNGVDLPGATSPTLELPQVRMDQAGEYSVCVSNGVGSVTSAPAVLTVLAAPVILTHPQSQSLPIGSNAVFTVSAVGSEPLHYQWYFNGSRFVGAVQPTLTLAEVTELNAGTYAVVVTNIVGAVTSTPATLTVWAPPQIDTPPASQTNYAGTTVQFSVEASGPGPLTYQWYYNSSQALPGATESVLVLTNVQKSQSGNYHVEVANPSGRVPSPTAVLTVWEVDWGDAPDPPYPTLSARPGAAHILNPGVLLGTRNDFEPDGQPEPGALGDDAAGGDDEDGVHWTNGWFIGQSVPLELVASTLGFLDVWVDFNHNGSWTDYGDKCLDARPLLAGTNLVNLGIPPGALPGPTFARFRFSTLGHLGPDGIAPNGEVEDYAVTLEPAANLMLAMAAHTEEVALGQDLAYTLVVTNAGASAASGVMLSNRLPAHVTFVSAAIGQGSCTAQQGVLLCQVGTLAAGQSTALDVVLTPLQAGRYPHEANVGAAEHDPNPADNTLTNSSAVFIPVAPLANPNRIALLDNGPAGVYPSTIFVSGLSAAVYRVTVTVNRLTHLFPDDIDMLLVGPTGQGVVLMSDAGSGNSLDQVTISFDDRAAQAISDSGVIVPGTYRPANHGGTGDTFPAPAPAPPYGPSLSAFYNTTPNGVWSLYCLDDALDDDGVIEGGWSLGLDLMNPMTDLQLAMDGPPGAVPMGTNLLYTLTVGNAGPATVPGIVLRDLFQGPAQVLEATSTQGACTRIDGGIECAIGTLAGGQSATITVLAAPVATGSVTNTATLIADVADSQPADNTARRVTVVLPITDVELRHSDLPETVPFDWSGTITLTVVNRGPSPVTGLHVADTVPAGIELVSVLPSQGACAPVDGGIDCALGALGVDGTATVALEVRSVQLGVWTNTARVSCLEMDINPANDTAAEVVTVESPPIILAQPVGLTVNNGDPATFAVTVMGTEPLSCQWRFNGADLPGATSNVLHLPHTSADQAGEYRVWITNRLGAVLSDPALLLVREPPSLSVIGDQTLAEDERRTVPFTVADSETPPGDLVVTASSANPELLPPAGLILGGAGATRTLDLVPATNRAGTTTVTLTVRDADGFEAAHTFAVTVTPVNDLPALTPFGNPVAAEDETLVLPFGIADVETPAGQLGLAAVCANPALVASEGLILGGEGDRRTLTVVPVANAFGEAMITVTVTDGEGGSAGQSFLLTLTPVDDPPTLDPPADLVLDEDAPEQTLALTGISPGATNENQSVTFEVVSSHPALIPTPTIAYAPPDTAGTLRFTPQPEQSGTATLTVTLRDSGSPGLVTARAFQVVVRPVNDLPVVTAPGPVTLEEDTATGPLTILVGDLESGAETLALSGYSSAPAKVPPSAFVFGGSGSNRTVTITPLPDAAGPVTVTLTVTDPDGGQGTAAFELSITPVNDLPAMTAIPDQTSPEDVPVVIPFHLWDVETPPEDMLVVAVSANQSLIPVSNIAFEASGSNWTLTLTPQTNLFGESRITISAVDAEGVVVRSTFMLTVASANDPPTLDPIPDLVLTEDAPEQVVLLTGITAGPANEDPVVTVTAVSDQPGIIAAPAVVHTPPSTTAELRFTPVPDASGIARISVTVDDGALTDRYCTRMLRVAVGDVDDPPTLAGPAAQTLDEDETRALSFTIADPDTPLDELWVQAVSTNPNLLPASSLLLSGSGAQRTVTVAPLANRHGSATVTLSVADDGGTNTATFDVVVRPVNDPPTLAPLPDLVLPEDAGPQTVALTGISSGADNEPEPVTLTVTTSDPGVIPQPVLTYHSPDATGTLAFEAPPEKSGTSTLTVTADDGQGAQTRCAFTVAVQSVNDLPVLSAIGDQWIQENTSTGPLPFTIGDLESPAPTLAVTARASNPALVPNANLVFDGSGSNRTLTVTPLPGRSGAAAIDLTVIDADQGATGITFLLFVAGIESIPVIAGVPELAIAEDASTEVPVVVGDDETPAAELTVSGVCSDAALVPPGGLVFGGSGSNRVLTFTPARDAFGSGTLTLFVVDARGNVARQDVPLTVTSVNDAPTLDPIAPLEVEPDAPPRVLRLTGIGAGAPNESQPLTVTAVSSHPAVVPDPVVTYASPASLGLLTIAPAAGATGTAVVTVTVNDGAPEHAATSQTFPVTVHPVNQPPTLEPVADRLTLQNAPITVPFVIGDAETPAASLVVSGASSDPQVLPDANFQFDGAGYNRTVTLTPAPGQAGFSTVSLTVTDEAGGTATASFLLRVDPWNTPPVLSTIADQVTDENTPVTVGFTVSDRDTPAASLLLASDVSDPLLVPATGRVLGGSGTNRTLTLIPTPHRAGSTTITLDAYDEQGWSSQAVFVLTVNGTNDPPAIAPLPDVTLPANGSVALPFAVADLETPAEDLGLACASTAASLLPASGIIFGGSGAARTVTLTPLPGQTGTAVVTLTVADAGSLVSSTTFTVTVEPAGTPPRITAHPESQTNAIGADVMLTVRAVGTPPLRYQWKHNGIPVPGATESMLVLSNAQPADAGLYGVRVSDVFGAVASETAQLTLLEPPLPGQAPTILRQPASLTLPAGESARFVVIAAGTAPLFYQWQRNGADLGGATSASLVLTNLQGADQGTYAVRVHNAHGSILSTAADLVVTGAYPASNTALVPPGAVWKYRDTGIDLGTAWREPAYDDSAWASGAAQFGYGEGDEDTVVSYGSDANNKYVTTYFRHAFVVEDPSVFVRLQVALLCDDGAALYLNGTEIVRSNLPAGPLAYATRPVTAITGTAEIAYATNVLDASLLLPGTNLLAAEIHQITAADADLSFDGALVAVPFGHEPPVLGAFASQTMLEDGVLALPVTVDDPDTEVFLVTLAGTSSNPALISATNCLFEGTGIHRTLRLVPAPNAFGTAQVSVTASDGTATATTTFSLTVQPVNDLPTLHPIPDLALADSAGSYTVNLTGISTGATNETQTLSLTVVSGNPTVAEMKDLSYLSPATTGEFAIDPRRNKSGVVPFTVTITEASPTTNHVTTQTFNVYVRDQANTVPTLTALADQTLAEDTATAALAFSVDDAQTAATALTVTARSSNPSLVPPAGLVLGGTAAARTLTVTPAPNQSGTAVITVQVVDDAFGMAQTEFTLTVAPVNDPPAISDLPDQSVSAGQPTALLPFVVGDPDTPAHTLTVTVASSNPTLLPPARIELGGTGSNRVVRLWPVPSETGSATVTVSVSDGVSSASDTCVLTVTPFPDPPAISSVDNQTVPEDTATAAIPLVVGDERTPAADLALTVQTSDASLLPLANVLLQGSGSNRTLTLTPAPDAFGNVRVTLTVTDEDLMPASTSFLLTVQPVNDPPTLDALADLTLDVDSGAHAVPLTGIGCGSALETQVVSVTATSSHTGLLPHPDVSYAPGATIGSLVLRPLPGASGTVTVTVSVSDGQAHAGAVSREFTVTFTELIALSAIADVSLDEDATLDVPFTVSVVSGDPGAVTVVAVSAHPSLLSGTGLGIRGVGGDRILALAPAPDQYGYTEVTLTATDAQGASASRTFTVVVRSVNDMPTIDPIAPLDLTDTSGPQRVPLTGISAGAGNEHQYLVVRAASSDPAVVPAPAVAYTSPDSTGSLTLAPMPNASGTALITVTVTDLQSQNAVTTTAFPVTVTAQNEPPVISTIAAQTTTPGTPVTVGFIVVDAETAASALEVTAVSSDTALVPATNLVMTGIDNQWLLTIVPAPLQTGTVTLTLSARDPEGAVGSQSFPLTIGLPNQPPSVTSLPDQTTIEATPLEGLDVQVADAETAADALLLVGHSSNPSIVPDANIVVEGSGNHRTVRILPAPDGEGTAWITLTVTDDGGGAASTGFLLRVTPVNDRPTLQPPGNQTMPEDGSLTVSFEVGDAETEPGMLLVTVASSNPALLPATAAVLGGNEAQRTVTLTPLPDAHGETTVTLTVHDGHGASRQAAFLLEVAGIPDPPVILEQPQDQATTLGGTATFEVNALGISLRYQWQHDQADLPGETNATLRLDDVQLADAGLYRVIVTGVDGSVASAEARLQLLVRPEVVSMRHADGSTEIVFTTVAGWTYAVEYSPSLADAVWREVTRVVADGGTMSVIDSDASDTTRFYRIRIP